jgi:hypothetical protein
MYDAGMTSLILLLAFAINPPPPPQGVVYDTCDVIDINTVYDLYMEDCHKPYLTQVLFIDTFPPGHKESGEECIVDWRLLKHDGMRPVRDHERGCWVMIWNDGDTLRVVKANHFRNSVTGYDLELEDREKHPFSSRRKLTSPQQLPPRSVLQPTAPPPDPQ